MNAKTRYSEKLKSPLWQRKRLEILSRDEFTCQLCGSTTKTLHVHHKTYVRGNEPWEAIECDLTTLCVDCHEFAGIKFTPLEKFLIGCLINRDREDVENIKNVCARIKQEEDVEISITLF